MRIVERIDHVAEQPGDQQRADDQHDVGRFRRGGLCEFDTDRDQHDRGDDRGDRQQHRAIGIVAFRGAAHLVGLVTEQRRAR